MRNVYLDRSGFHMMCHDVTIVNAARLVTLIYVTFLP